MLALIGVGAGVVTYALPSSPSARTLSQEAALFTSRLNLMTERSLIEGRVYRLNWKSDSYSFELWEGDSWGDVMDAALAEPHLLAPGLMLTGQDSERRGFVQVSPDLMPPQSGNVRFALVAGSTRQLVLFDGAAAQLVEP